MASVPPAPGAAPEVDWHGRVWRIAWPTILSNLTQPVVGAVDTGVAGHLAGSVSSAVESHAQVPVLVVHEPS